MLCRISHKKIREQIKDIDFKFRARYKHVYLIVGEPRVGKTTLGFLATFLSNTQFIDTDEFEELFVLSNVREKMNKFIEDSDVCVLAFSTGKHRKMNGEIETVIREFQSENVLITICRCSR